MKALHAIVAAFLVGVSAFGQAEKTSDKLRGMIPFKPQVNLVSKDEPILLESFTVTEKKQVSPSFERMIAGLTDMLAAKQKHSVEIIGDVPGARSLADSPIVGFSLERISDLKQLQGGYEFRYGQNTTTVYFRSGLIIHPEGDKNVDYVIKPPKLFRVYRFKDGEDLLQKGIISPIVSPFKRILEKTND